MHFNESASSTVENVPAIAPPPGTIPNFDNPVTRRPLFTAVIAICLALVWLVFILRLYTSINIDRKIRLDDFVASLAVLSTTFLAAGTIYGKRTLLRLSLRQVGT